MNSAAFDRLKLDEELTMMAGNANGHHVSRAFDQPHNKKGPAEVAASPSHGSTNPDQEKAVNRQQATTIPAEATRAPFDFREAYFDLHDFIADVEGRAKILWKVADWLVDLPKQGPVCTVPSYHVEDVLFMVEDVRASISKLVEQIPVAWTADVLNQPGPAREREVLEADMAELQRRILDHRAAAAELEAAVIADGGANASARGWEDSERTLHAKQEEERAFDALLMLRPRTIAANRARLSYLRTDPASPWKDDRPSEKKLDLLFASMMEA